MSITVFLQTIALVIVGALLVAAGAAQLARMDGASYAKSLVRAATAFATVITLAASVTAALASLFA
ncbi:hypothetical protein ACGFYZ_31685 [Streptomyces sp. NPDC048330]|uniref:hypothetical protein n=1 Tax=Streptomyces sp. NPDC048330 TaxID=3365533 RepID=UPI0037228004